MFVFQFACCTSQAVEAQVVEKKSNPTNAKANGASNLTDETASKPVQKEASTKPVQKEDSTKPVQKEASTKFVKEETSNKVQNTTSTKTVQKAASTNHAEKEAPTKSVPKIPNSAGDLKVIQKLNSALPGAYTNEAVVSSVMAILKDYAFGETTLLATSLCSDEVNRDLENKFAAAYGDNFSMGGLAGFPFGGVTGFQAMASHIPNGGSCLIVYGPHVGIDADGNIGKVNRRGRKTSGSCCGSAAAAAEYVKSVRTKTIDEATIPDDLIDLQQAWVSEALLPHGERLEKAADAKVELPLALFDCQHEMMMEIVAEGCSKVPDGGYIALLGGIQINTPEGTSDCFLPKVFKLFDNKRDLKTNLIEMLA